MASLSNPSGAHPSGGEASNTRNGIFLEAFLLQLRSFSRLIMLAPVGAVLLLLGLASAGLAQSSPPQASAALKAALQSDLNAYLKKRGAVEHLSSLSLSVSLSKDAAPINLTAGTTRYGSGPPVTP